MDNINIKIFKRSDDLEKDKNLYRLTDNNNKEIYLKLINVRLPFNYQLYNKNLYINAELFKEDVNYDDNICLINKFEDCINKMFKELQVGIIRGINKTYNSIIKIRKMSIHLKLMLKRDSKDILLTVPDGICIKKLSEYHKLGYRYDIVIKPEILWENNDSYGVIFYLFKINIHQKYQS